MSLLINILYAAINYGAPLMLGTTGEILSEKAGNLNLGVEGMMWMGAFAGFYTAYKADSLILALIVAFTVSASCALIYAILTVTLRANQNVVGLAITTFGIGLAKVFGESMVRNASGASVALSGKLDKTLSPVEIPFLSDIPIIGKLLFNYNILIYLSVLICIVIAFYLKRTRMGLNLRAVGENPSAADAAGISVNKIKYINIVLGGGLCGIGGAYMSLVTANGLWMQSGIVNGFGWISVALVIFATWKPIKAILGAFLFGFFTVLQFYPIISVPTAIYQMLPFLLTTIVLIISSVRKRREGIQPESCGVNYFREER